MTGWDAIAANYVGLSPDNTGPRECIAQSFECLGPDCPDACWRCLECDALRYHERHNDSDTADFGGQTLITTDNRDWLFVYGTLLDHEPNASMLPTGAERHMAAAPGEMYYVSGHTGGYPVVTPRRDADNAQDWVYGELLQVDIYGEQMAQVTLMELGAGYDLRWSAVTHIGTGEVVNALMFVWPWNEKGARIGHGNWRNRVNG